MKDIKVITTDQFGEVSGSHLVPVFDGKARDAIKRHFKADKIVSIEKQSNGGLDGRPIWRVAIDFSGEVA